jgi:RNA polymerase sigma factor (TIGR02999 family)
MSESAASPQSSRQTEITRLLAAAGRGDPRALESLLALVYDELKRIARRHLRASSAKPMLCTTELVHEAFLRMVRGNEVGWEGRAHFFGVASRAMRQVLVDFARRRQAARRSGQWRRTTLDDGHGMLEFELDEILAVDEALNRLNDLDQRLRQVVELRFFGGLSDKEIAEMLGVSARTVERDWLKARLFLVRELELRSKATGGPAGETS